jgi:hypothetical protein
MSLIRFQQFLFLSAVLFIGISASATNAESPSARPASHIQCENLNKDFESMSVSKDKGQIAKTVAMIGKLPKAKETDPDRLITSMNKDFASAWEETISPAPNCGSLRLHLVRHLIKLSSEKNISKEDKQKVREAILTAVSTPQIPFLIDSMINLGVLREAVDAGLFPQGWSVKEQIATRTEKAKKDIGAASEKFMAIFKGTPFEEGPKSEPTDYLKIIRDPKQQELVEKYKTIMIGEIKLAAAVQQDVDKFVLQLQK